MIPAAAAVIEDVSHGQHKIVLGASDMKSVFVVMQNSDLTEGRGHEEPIAVCGHALTAIRLSHKQGVMGTNAAVVETLAFKIAGVWYAPARIVDMNRQDQLNLGGYVKQQLALKKAREAGMSDDEIAALGLKWL